jgi:hypothetical protein
LAKDEFSNFETPLQVQPPKGSAEGPLEYGEVAEADMRRDPMGVLPKDTKARNIGPSSRE